VIDCAASAGLALLVTACSSPSDTAGDGNDASDPLTVGAIPDQNPEQLQRRYGQLTDYLEAELEVPVTYNAVVNYTAAVTAFRVGELDLVWFGGLTGLQARSQVEGARAITQRAIDRRFTSTFIAHVGSGLEPIEEVSGLQQLAGRTFTFGSPASTSGRLMPQYFLAQAGLKLEDLRGEPGFSGAHDKTLQLVAAGTYEAGALNSQVWRSRVEAGRVDRDRVRVIWETPEYADYQWVLHPQVADRYGEALPQQVQDALLALDGSTPRERRLLQLFQAERFVAVREGDYARLRQVACQLDMLADCTDGNEGS